MSKHLLFQQVFYFLLASLHKKKSTVKFWSKTFPTVLLSYFAQKEILFLLQKFPAKRIFFLPSTYFRKSYEVDEHHFSSVLKTMVFEKNQEVYADDFHKPLSFG